MYGNSIDNQLLIQAYDEYKNKKYQKSISLYKSTKNHNSTIYYNIGNCYAMLHNYKLSIAFYKNSLKYKSDKDALSNLTIVTKLYKKEQELSKRDKSKKTTSTIKNLEAKEIDFENEIVSKGKTSINIKGSKRNDNISNILNNTLQDEISIASNIKQNQSNIKSKYIFTSIQEQRYDKQLLNRQLHTLLIPIENQENKKITKGTDEQYPW